MLRNVKVALFDLDGVVVFTDKFHFFAWKKLSQEMDWKFDESINHKLRGVSRLASLGIILAENGVKLSAEDQEELAARKNHYYVESLKEIGMKDMYPGVVDFIRQLKERGVLIALCSASRNARRVLDQLNITDLFDCVVTGADIKETKPDPEVFLKAAKELNRHPFNCVVFEDAESGIEAARRGGFRHVGIGTSEMLPNADETILSYNEIDVDFLIEFGCIRQQKVDPWKVVQLGKTPIPQASYWESLFSLANGFQGVRGAYEEESESLMSWAHPGSYINGVYETKELPSPERIDDLKKQDVLVNLFDWRLMTVCIDGHQFSFDCGQVEGHRRELDMQNGVLRRFVVWETPDGKQVEIETVRLVSMTRLHSAAIRYTVRPLNFSGQVDIFSAVEGKTRTSRLMEGGLRKKTVKKVDGDVLVAHYQMEISKLDVALSCAHAVKEGLPGRSAVSVQQQDDRTEFVFRFEAMQGDLVQVDKHVCLYSSLETEASLLEESVVQTVAEDRNVGMDRLLEEQAAFWRDIWEVADITVDGCPADQQAIRFELFQLRQNHTAKNRRSISATGLSGDNYCGWIFWDTEIFMLPFFLYHDPAAAKALLEYRCNTLAGARQRATEVQLPGACYGWSTLDGTENNVGFNASTAQYHLGSDIGYALWQYYNATQDFEFIAERGMEVLVEICRMFAELGKFIPARGNKFCINYVTGPDEYNYHVNNNCFTNMMVQKHFEFTLEMMNRLQEKSSAKAAALMEKLSLTVEEISRWRQIVENIYIPFNEELQIHEQDDGYLYRNPVDMDALPDNFEFKYNFTELNLGRMQVSKQADVVLTMLLLGDRFPSDIKCNNFDFYIQRTKHVSSLSACIHSIMAAETGRNELVYSLLRQTICLDLCDLKKNTGNGIHFACAGGSWMVVVNGLAGMRDQEEGLSFNPRLPDAWNGYRFKIRYRGRLLEVCVAKERVCYVLLEGEPLKIRSNGELLVLDPKHPFEQEQTAIAAAR